MQTCLKEIIENLSFGKNIDESQNAFIDNMQTKQNVDLHFKNIINDAYALLQLYYVHGFYDISGQQTKLIQQLSPPPRSSSRTFMLSTIHLVPQAKLHARVGAELSRVLRVDYVRYHGLKNRRKRERDRTNVKLREKMCYVICQF